MKISSKQALILFEIAKWSTRVHGGVAGYSSESIVKLVNDIINQQDDTPVELDSNERRVTGVTPFAGFNADDFIRYDS